MYVHLHIKILKFNRNIQCINLIQMPRHSKTERKKAVHDCDFRTIRTSSNWGNDFRGLGVCTMR